MLPSCDLPWDRLPSANLNSLALSASHDGGHRYRIEKSPPICTLFRQNSQGCTHAILAKPANLPVTAVALPALIIKPPNAGHSTPSEIFAA
jgi:hypothetical protein